MYKKLPFILTIILWFCVSHLIAREGKVFFESDRWLKGDIQIQQDDFGKEVVVIALKSGSVIVPRSEVKNIIYTSSNMPGHSNSFHRAFQNTRSQVMPSRSPSLYDSYIRRASAKYQLDPELVKAVIKQESDFKRLNTSPKGAQGLMQLMPGTAQKLGVHDAYDPWENIHGGTRYLRMMLENFDGDLVKALAAYNAGPGAVKKYGTVPPYRETLGYVKDVLRYYHFYRGSQLFSFEDNSGKLIVTDRPYFP